MRRDRPAGVPAHHPKYMTHAAPYVHAERDLEDYLPQLVRGGRLAVLTLIGLRDADPVGASAQDICDALTLSRPTVMEALRYLEQNEMIAAEDGLYRPLRFFHFCGNERLPLPLTLPVAGEDDAGTIGTPTLPEAAKKNFFSHDDDVSLKVPSKNLSERHHHHHTRAREILLRAGVTEGRMLDVLAGTVSEEVAQGWADWIATNPPGFTRPAGFLVSRLLADPSASPPAESRKTWYTEAERTWFK